MRRTGLLAAAMGLAICPIPAAAQTNQQVADEVISITKAEWEAIIAQRPVSASMAHIADEYTEFNPGFPVRLDGKPVVMRLNEAGQTSSDVTVSAEMANPKVQVYGDVAVLSYNYIGQTRNADGQVEPSLAKSTRVYVKQGGQWKLVHANFAPVGDGN